MEKKNILAIGASFRDLTLNITLVDLTGAILDREQERMERNHSSVWAPALVRKISGMLSKSLKPGRVFAGLGFSTGGIYDPEKGVFRCFSSGAAPETRNDEQDIDVSGLLKPAFPGMKVVTDDFPNAMAMGEMWFGCAGSENDFLYLQLINPKATVVSERAIVRGARHYAGEVAGWRYGSGSMDAALKKSGYSPEVLADFFLNLVLAYAPGKIILSLENLPPGADLEATGARLAGKMAGTGLAGLRPPPVECGRLGREDSAVAAAALMFDEYFNTFNPG